MIEWLSRVESSLNSALDMAERGDIPLQNLYMLATILYSQEKHTNNESLLQEMSEANEEQVESDCAIDAQSKFQYKFHYVSSYLNCYVVAGKMDEFEYDRIMDYVTQELDLFTRDYEPN